MFPNEKARLMRMMDSHGIPAINESGAKMDFTQRVTWLIEHANQQSVQADEFSGHANNCVLRSGGYACTCGAAETTRR